MGTTIEISRGFVQIFEHIFVIEIFLYDFLKWKNGYFIILDGLKKWRMKIYGGSGEAGHQAGWPLCFYSNFRNLIERKIYEMMILG